jgi:cytochrome c5
MRHVQIARLTWVLTGLFAGAAVLFAATRPAEERAVSDPAADPAVAAAAFETHCAQCHGRGEFGHWAALRPDPEERCAWLDRFLETHFPPPEEARPLIIDHIEQAIAEGG